MHVRGPNRRAVLRGTAVAAMGAAVGAAAGCGRERSPGLDELVIATGPPGAVFREIGAELRTVLAERMPDTDVRVVETNASNDNLRLLESDGAQLGLSSIDAVVGDEVTADDELSAIGRIYDSSVHLLVMADSPVERLADLEGLRVSVGAVDSGTEFTATRIIEETGLDTNALRMDQAASADALAAGTIDAMLSLTGLPTPAIATLAHRRSVRLVGLTDIADTMADVHPDVYFPASIPATTYDGVPAVPTLSVPNLLLCRNDLPDDLAYLVTDTLFTRASRLAASRPEAAQINVRTGISTGVVPLHPGATRWYRDRKPD